MRKDLTIGTGVGIPVVILMILIGGGGHSSFDFEELEKKFLLIQNKLNRMHPMKI